MKKMLLLIFVILMALAVSFWTSNSETKWSGVDESVVKKFADQAGRPPWEPFINTGQGDLLLFVFLVAGALGGFVVGYYYRELFPPRSSRIEDRSIV